MAKRPATRPTLEEAKRQYPHRYTCEHVPAWARTPAPNGRYYAPQYRSDQEWYENTVFPPESGSRNHCHSTKPTWPHGHWLVAPYTIGVDPQPFDERALWQQFQKL